MTVHHLTNRPKTGTCLHCGVEKPDDELAIYMSAVDMGWHGTCEECHAKAEVPVKFWELYKLSELRAGTAFGYWWKPRRFYHNYCDSTED